MLDFFLLFSTVSAIALLASLAAARADLQQISNLSR